MNKKGFTFIEVIIIFTIVFIMTAVMMSISYKDRSKKEIETVAREVTASIRETQNNALTGKQKGNDTFPCAFKFGFDSGGYQMFYSSRGIDSPACPADDDGGVSQPFFDRILLPDDMTMSAIAQDYNGNVRGREHVIFLVPYGDFIIDNGGELVEYKGTDIVIAKDGRKYHICVHATGLIEEIGFDEADFVCAF